MKTSTNIKIIIENIVNEILKESSGKEPSKEQIDATFSLLKSVIQKNPKWSGKVFVAGGAVRDMVMGLNPKDIDLVVEMEEGGIKFATFLAQFLGIYRGTSNPVIFPAFGTAKVSFDGVVHEGVPLDGVDVEVVNTREEQYEPGNRKPTTKHGTIKSDVFRRDLTINSLLMDLVSGEIVDLTGQGREDIAKGVIRTPSEPDRIFSDDPLRLMRAIRFAGRYNYTMPDYMKDSVKKNAPQLTSISRERVREELEKTLKGANPEVGMAFLYDLGLMPFVLPEVQSKREQSVTAARKGKDFNEKMALVLEGLPVETVNAALRNLKFSNEELAKVSKIVEALNLVGSTPTVPAMLKAGTDLVSSGLERYVSVLEDKNKGLYDQTKKWFNNGPAIYFKPNDIIALFKLKPGPVVGKMMAFQKNLWYNNPNLSQEEALDAIKKEFKL